MRLMALNCSSSQISIRKYGSFLKHSNKNFLSKHNYAPQKKAPIGPVALKVSASIMNKVYEDESQGIVCYEDENGEIICEGYDEGPRYQGPPRPTYHPRDVEIMNLLLKQSGVQILKGEDIKLDAVDGANNLKEDLNFNGFC